MTVMSYECWEPLEATSEVFNALSAALGVVSYHFVQVFDLATPFVQDPLAVILLYPTLPALETYRQRPAIHSDKRNSTKLFFLRQLMGGSCGTIAALHALVNGIQQQEDKLPEPLVEIWESEYSVDPGDILQRSKRLLLDTTRIRQAHLLAAAAGGDGTSGQVGQRQGRHFITFVRRSNTLWELDGRREEGPLCRGNVDLWTEVRNLLLRAENHPRIHYETSVLALVPK
eukprot:scaffold978_cov164-Amphora_coffeaeformis.AAC.4